MFCLGAKVIIACRDVERSNKVSKEISDETGNKVEMAKLNLGSFKSVRKFANGILDNEPQIHVLINNAGKNKIQIGYSYNSY